jgi:hypothetical protein
MGGLSEFTFHFVDAQETIALGAALPAVCILVLGLRFFTRRLQKVQVGIDDWLAVGGLVCLALRLNTSEYY